MSTMQQSLEHTQVNTGFDEAIYEKLIPADSNIPTPRRDHTAVLIKNQT